MISFSLDLMVLGMFTVFVFLGILMLCIHVVRIVFAKSIEKERLERIEEKKSRARPKPRIPAGAAVPVVVAAAAVRAYEEGL